MNKGLILLGVAALALVIGAGLAVNRLAFLAGAQKTTGHVSLLSSHNDRCGGRRNRHRCTKYSATVEFPLEGRAVSFTVEAGQRRGHDQPLTGASLRVGDAVRVVHARGGLPAYRDAVWDVWGAPLLSFFFAFASGFGAFFHRGR